MNRNLNRQLSHHYSPLGQKKASRLFLFPLIAGAIVLSIGIVLFTTFAEMRLVPNWTRDVTFLLPGVAFMPVAFVARKEMFGRGLIYFSTILLLVLSIVSLPVGAMQGLYDIYVTPVTDPATYTRTMGIFDEDAIPTLRVFPDELPQDAQDPQFLYQSDLESGKLTLSLQFRCGEGTQMPLINGMKGAAVWQGSKAEMVASEYAMVAEHVDMDAVPEDATCYVLLTKTVPSTGELSMMMFCASADDGYTQYLFKILIGGDE